MISHFASLTWMNCLSFGFSFLKSTFCPCGPGSDDVDVYPCGPGSDEVDVFIRAAENNLRLFVILMNKMRMRKLFLFKNFI
jgi:hypothetical protein